MKKSKQAIITYICLSLGLLFSTAFGADVPKPTFSLPLDGTVVPDIVSNDNPLPIETSKVRYVPGKKGQAVLLGDGPVLAYRGYKNIPEEATVSFWIKPDWKQIDKWRWVLSILPAGRQIMMFANYPKHQSDMQFLWSDTKPVGHETTKGQLKNNEWNHVAVAWDGIRSRVYFNGELVLTKKHPSGFRPQLGETTTLQLGGIVPSISGSTYSNPPWGVADTAIDELKVFPGMLAPDQIAMLAEREDLAAGGKLTGPAKEKQTITIPKLRKTPKLDGHLTDGEWDGAAVFPVLIHGKNPARSFDAPQQRVYLSYDDANLYVAMRSYFPGGYKVLEGPKQNRPVDSEVELWTYESFEFYLMKDGNPQLYRFAGTPSGAYTELYDKDYSWNGEWTYRTAVGRTEFATDFWDVEFAIPFKTLNMETPDAGKLRVNFCRTWRGFDDLRLTSLAGEENYPAIDYFADIHFSPSMPAYSWKNIGNIAMGEMTRDFTLRNFSDTPYNGNLTVSLLAGAGEDSVVRAVPLNLAPGEKQEINIPIKVDDPRFQRVEITLADAKTKTMQTRYSVPFQLRSDFLDLVPLCLQNKLVIKPLYSLFVKSLKKIDGRPEVLVRVFANEKGKAKPVMIAERKIRNDADVWIDLPKDGPVGDYRVDLVAMDEDGKVLKSNSRRFYRPATPVWMTRRDDSMDTVLPPFTPLVTKSSGKDFTVGCWGREYKYQNSLVPTSIQTGGIDDILAGPMSITVSVNDKEQTLPAGALEVKKQSEIRDEYTVTASCPEITARNKAWIEYDGLIYNTLELRAKKNVKNVRLRVPYRPEYSQFAHLTGGLMSLSGGYTRKVDESFNDIYWPVVWIGDFEQGLCFFTEGRDDLATSADKPFSVVKDAKSNTLVVTLADEIHADRTVTVKFGFLATPVKPLHPRYPLNMLADRRTGTMMKTTPPKRHANPLLYWTFHHWFMDIPFRDEKTGTFITSDKQLAALCKQSEPWIPYFDPYTLSSEYPEANYYLREWEKLPAEHRKGGYIRETPNGPVEFIEYWMSPQAESFRKYYAWRVADLIQRTGIRGLYFDFATALPDANKYHGANGGYPILAVRDYYRRLANEFVKAGVEDYVLVGHNSKSVQIPALTFLTHFFNGEHHRLASGSTLREGKDYLDTLPLYYFGIEQSGLPWGIHGNMLVELQGTEHLVREEAGVKDETVTEYLANRTPSVVMPILLHNCLPGASLVDSFYFKNVFGVLEDFDVPTAKFHPYWRNSHEIKVDNPDFKVSFYTRPEAPRALLVVGNLSKKPGVVNIRLDMTKLYDWSKADTANMQVEKKNEILQAVERIGARDARIITMEPNQIKVWVKGHSMALIEVSGHQRTR